ncbi:WXG100 family type VII secretion target [Catenuloplanes sp. NPDC051500]|uniref:WXG100 family type VII secretion target n=1 Tax=Catenuloplanes sp. NPDC051500 TaxID=3363959 RepID=UPI00379687BC
MADVTTVDVAALVGAAVRCEEAAARLRALLDGVRAAWPGRGGSTVWQGRGGEAFEEVRRGWAAEQEALVSALAETGVLLRATAARYVATDDGAAWQIAAAVRLGAGEWGG